MLPVTDEAGYWGSLEALFRIDHVEEDARAGRPARPASDTATAVGLRHDLATAARYLVAERENGVVGCLGVWVDEDGWAVIEDVFVHPDARDVGVATQMLRFAVHYARARGAGRS